MRRPALLVFALTLVACPNEGGVTDTSETSSEGEGEGSGSDEVASTVGDTTPGETDTNNDVPDCTPGAFGCICGEGDTCSPDLACTDGICTFSDCTDGYDGCPCAEGGVCNDGLFCIDDTCGCMPGTLGCDCVDDNECSAGGLSCIDGECWLPSEYPNCGWNKAQGYYFCGFNIAHPDWPIDCPAGELMNGLPCLDGLTFEGCCGVDGSTWWCQDGVIASMAC